MTPARPKTGSSVASSLSLSSLPTMSVASSCNGSQLNAIVQRRAQLRAQLAVVQAELGACPEMAMAPPRVCACGPGRRATPSPSLPVAALRRTEISTTTHAATQPGSCTDMYSRQRGTRPELSAAIPPAIRTGASSSMSAHRLPGALQDGRYAFWPKQLPVRSTRCSNPDEELALPHFH